MADPKLSPEPSNYYTDRTIRSWPRESVADRLARCLAMLTIHGFVSDGDRRKIGKRLPKPSWSKR